MIPLNGIPQFVVGILLLLAEFLGLLQFVNLQVLFTKPYVLTKKDLSEYKHPPSVDVFICTYNESCSLLEKTIMCALNLDYEKEKINIFVCDDGHRMEVKALCDSYQVGYITRDTNEGAKAGNINNALLRTQGELFAVLDADMLCTKSFLTNTVGYFSKPETAFVQTPQVYYNKDMYQHNLRKEDIPNEQDFFMRDIQTGRAAFNAVLHVGTNAVFRREYIMEIGMYPTNSITEDMAVGMLLQAKGYDGIFINEPLVLGISVSNYTDLAIQRDRWCRGNLQVIRHFNPFFKKGLNFFQKLIYFDGTLYWFTSFQKLIFLLCPTLFLLTGIRSLNTDLSGIISIFLPYFIGSILIFKAIAPDSRSLKWAHIYEVAMAPHTCVSIIKQLFSMEIDFKVTPKESRDDHSYFQFHVIIPHLILGTLTLISWAVGAVLLAFHYINFYAFLINMVWSIYNAFGIFLCIRVSYQLSEKTPEHFTKVEHSEFFDMTLLLNGTTKQVFIEALSETGFTFRIEDSSISEFQKCLSPGNGKAKLHMSWKDQKVCVLGNISGTLKENILYFTYTNFGQKEKLALMSFYIDHLRPVFSVLPKQRYTLQKK